MHNGKSITTRKSVEALAEELKLVGFSDLAADVTFGPIAVAACMTDKVEAEHDVDIDDDSIEDVLDEFDDDNDDDDNDDSSNDCDDSADSFEEVLDDADIEAADNVQSTDRLTHLVVLDPDRRYSKQELRTLRAIANTCIARNHLVANAKVLLESLDAYEYRH